MSIDETDEEYKERKKRIDSDNMLKAGILKGVIKGFMDEAYGFYDKDHNFIPNEAQVALDIWAVLDNRREGDDFVINGSIYGNDDRARMRKLLIEHMNS